jgi:glycosyltransferase involved in cell wall biosynthesis
MSRLQQGIRRYHGGRMPESISPQTIAVDLTPVLPGGENGGAKVFALELVRRLAALAPRTRFVLLTQAASHDELAALDRENVERMLVVNAATSSLRASLFAAAARVLSRLPGRIRQAAARMGYRIHVRLKRRGSAGLLRRIGADLLFCPFTAPTYREKGIPTVCTIYDLQYRVHPEFFAVEDAVQRERAFAEACAEAKALAAISEFSREAAIAEGGLDPRSIRTIYMRLASGERRSTDRVPAGLALEPGKYLAYPANFWRHKNHEALLKAFSMACGQGLPADIRLVCTGAPGARMESLRALARELGLADRVVFPGFLPHEDLAALIAESRGVIFPSLYEGFGLPVIEAMDCGVPVACSDAAALPEAAGGAALLFDPRDAAPIARALVSLATDEALRARLIEAGTRRAREFSDTDRMAREYWQLFLSAMGAK